MNADEFWGIIESVHGESRGDMERKCELLKKKLMQLKEQDLRDFIRHFSEADAKAYSWPLWGAAYVMHGGCSDDSFSDFRAMLISRGRKEYEAALTDPDSLAGMDFKDEDICFEGYQYVMDDVAEEKLGEVLEREATLPDQPHGKKWDEDAVYELYPRLSARYFLGDDTGKPKKSWWKFWA